jgi:excisionase family DNA binding protein
MKLAYSVTDAAELLSISPTEVRRLVRDGLLGKVPHCGKRVLIAHAELERFTSAGVLPEEAAA